jgi:RHS repeat-associated protein
LPAYTDPITGNTQWSQAFAYDNNSNIISQVTARNITITNGYDKLNRVVTRTYSDGTPSVNYFYDGTGLSEVPANSKGKLTKVTNTVSENRFVSFDVMGKVLKSQQITDGNTYETLYNYDSFGKLLTETYPSGRVVKNEFDMLGRLASVSSKSAVSANQPSPVFHIYANGFGYNDKGQPDRMRLGNGLWESIKYNNKFQVTQLGLGTSQSNANRLKIEYEYGEIDEFGNLDITKNNGNVARQKITVPAVGSSQGFVATQSYEYDELNRLKSAIETSNSQTNWQQHFRYDRYGNRTVITEQNRIGQEAFTTASIVGLNPDINIANNRIVPKQNSSEQYEHDADGNLIKDKDGARFVYDANSKQAKFFKSTNSTNEPDAFYYYDAADNRIKKREKKPNGIEETTIFVYDVSGKLVAEYTLNAQPVSNPTTTYLTKDIHNSPRVNTDAQGQVIARHDYLPFGDEIVGLGQRNQHAEYRTDSIRQKFTGYQKDGETGLDFAKARYYGNGLGRFTSLDPLMSSARLGIPQSWNRYSYCINNPIRFTDPTGMDWYLEYVREGGRTYRNPVWYTDAPAGSRPWNGGDIHRAIDTATGQKVWQVLNPWEGEMSSFATLEQARTQFSAYKQQAFIDRAAGMLSGYFTTAEISIVLAAQFGIKTPFRTNSEQFKLGQKIGSIGAWGTVALGGGGLASILIGKALQKGVKIGLAFGPSAGGKLAEWAGEKGLLTLTSKLFTKPTEMGWTEFSRQVMEEAVSRGVKIHFDLTHVENIEEVLAGTFKADAVTSYELRYLRDNWERFQSTVTFYRNGQVVNAPW